MGSRTACSCSMPHRPLRARRRRAVDDERGQAAVEFAIALPLVVVVVLAVVQVGVSVRNQLAVEAAARAGARAAAASAHGAVSATRAASGAIDLPIEVSVRTSGDSVTVTVTHVDPTDVAIIGAAIGPVTHTASATMAIEPP
ncbi:TadE/TadG family type IV pilus assembly protein [Ilumatobacter sp.]|uniref:TadE/TadG family type IV pilus assembly protein n=1 Tax=Ilumatobacter sp. TaxID=1967498 RepID=UPI003B51900F